MVRTDRVILVTGAASGIGLATAHLLARQGAARLVMVDRDAEALARVDLPCPVDLLPGDVADEAFWDAAAPRLQGLTGAVANAGTLRLGTVATTSLAEWRAVLSTNLDGAFLTLRAAIRAIDGPGAIVAVSSATALKTRVGTGAYSAAKAGLIQLVRVAARENAARGLRVMALAPGGVDTPFLDGIPSLAERTAEIGRDDAVAERAAHTTPMGRFARPEEMAEQIAFLLSDAAAMMTGSVMVCDGGYSL